MFLNQHLFMLMRDFWFAAVAASQAKPIRMPDVVFQITPLKVIGAVICFQTINMIDGVSILESLAESKRDKTMNRNVIGIFGVNLL